MPNDKPYIRPWNAPGKNGTETSMGSIYDWVDNLQENPDTLSPIFSVENAIPPQICDYIVKKSQVENDQFREAATGADKNVDHQIRRNKIMFSELKWVNALLYGFINDINGLNFRYDLHDFDVEAYQISKYLPGDFYEQHSDRGWTRNTLDFTRKLSVSLQLSGPEDYEGGELIIYPAPSLAPWVAPKKKGTLVVFDSLICHEVKPVISGVRYSAVKWVHGERPFR